MAHGPGSGYEQALVVDDTSSERQLALAADLLETCGGIVLLDGMIAVRPGTVEIRCEVIDPDPSAHRCAEEFKVMVENAARRLAASTLGSRLPERPVRWLVVEDGESGLVELWTAPARVNPE
jgi:hypothetical protein